MLTKIRKIIYTSLEIANKNSGYIGPIDFRSPKESDTEKELKFKHWPHAVYFRALMAEYDATNNIKILEALINHYKSTPPIHIGRSACNVECLA